MTNCEHKSAVLHNNRGDSVRILTLGAIISELNIATSKQGNINVVLGYPHLRSYLKDTAYHGAIVGRYCNRIANSQFSIGSQQYQLEANEGEHHLHGGVDGFNRRDWSIEQHSNSRLTLSLHSPDGDQGYPGNLDILLQYMLKDDGTLEIDWQATSDRDTVIGLTSHGYFNLAGCGDTLDHYLRIAASHYTPANHEQIPSGEIESVEGTALDLRSFTRLGTVLESGDPRLAAPFDGLDHNWARGSCGEMLLSAELYCPDTSLLLQTSSTLPGLQCYSGNHLMSNGIHESHEGICLEPQFYPNSPNQPEFPSPFLLAGETIRHSIHYRIREVSADELSLHA